MLTLYGTSNYSSYFLKKASKNYFYQTVPLTLEYIHVVFVTLTPTLNGSHPVCTPLNEIIKIIKCDLNWSQCDLRGPGWGSVTFTNRLQVLSDVTLTDIKNFHFGDFYFLIFFKYRHVFNTQGGNHPPSQWSFGPAKDLLEDFDIFRREWWDF